MNPGDPMLGQVLDKGVLIPLLIAGSIVSVSIVRAVCGVFKANARERTRREIAAFIAEGSMSPEQGERLMKAGNGSGSCC